MDTGVLKFCWGCRSQYQLSGAGGGQAALPALTGTAAWEPTHRRVGPMQLVSVLSISRSMRSCSAAVSTLAILHVAMDSSEQTGWVLVLCVTQEGPEGRLDVTTEQPE